MDVSRYVKHLQIVSGQVARTLTDVAKSETFLHNPPIETNSPVQWKCLEIPAGPGGGCVRVPWHA